MRTQLTNYQSITPPHFPLNRFSTSSRFILFFLLSMFLATKVFAQLPYTLTGNANWGTMSGGTTPPLAAANGVIVGGYELKIEGITLTLNSGKSITVGSGGLIQLTDAIIQSSGSNTWQGITATGGSSTEQYTTFPSKVLNDPVAWAGVLNGSQTQVICNNSDINKAKIGIKSTAGAIIQTRNGGFTNCEKAIVIESYASLTHAEVNACYFMGTDFIWSDILLGFNSVDFVGISMTNVRGVNIGGCTFLNNDPDLYCNLVRGIGILSSESDFGVSTDGDELCSDGRTDCEENCFSTAGDGSPTTFEGLTKGIVTEGHHSTRRDRIGIRDCSFTDLLSSVEITYAKHTSIFESNFTATRSAYSAQYDIGGGCDYLSGTVIKYITITDAGANRIVQNDLTFDDAYCEYITMNGSGTNGSSLIRKNTIHNSNSGIDVYDGVIGIVSQGNNTKLDIKCNNFQNLSNDIFIATGSTLKDIMEDVTNKSNNNVLSSTIGNARINIFNDGSNITVKYEFGSQIPSRGGSNSANVLRQQAAAITCDDIDDCSILMDETGVGIRKLNSNDLKVYPNPAYSLLYIDLKRNELNHPNIVIYDLQGKELINGLLNESLQVDISNLPIGLLFIRVVNGNTIYTQKIMKN